MTSSKLLAVSVALAVTLSGCFLPPPTESVPASAEQRPLLSELPTTGADLPSRRPSAAEVDPAQALPETQVVWEWGVRWGESRSGPLLPRRVQPLSGIVSVSSGLEHGLALRSDGTVWGWGDRRASPGDIQAHHFNQTPVRVDGLTDVVAVAAGDFHNLALRADGTLWSWGYNASGQLGNGTRDSRPQPELVQGLSDVVAIAAGMSHSLALRQDGTVWAWGYGVFGALGNGTHTTSLVPTQVTGLDDVVSIAAGGRHSLAVRADGSVWGWGFGLRGAIGEVGWGAQVPVPIAGLTGVAQVGAGWNHSLAVTGAGELFSWGDNEFGQLGLGFSGGMTGVPSRVEGLPPVVSAAGGEHFSAAVAGDGQTFVWGDDLATTLRREEHGEASRATPRPVVALHGITQVSARGSSVVAIQGDVERRLEAPRFVRGAR
jgi:alpha-tubulin suppressor-like RCC1 family protein